MTRAFVGIPSCSHVFSALYRREKSKQYNLTVKE